MDDQNTYSETEQKIFKAALKEFGRYGKKGARMQHIAEAAGCNKALVHYYFRSKEKLFEQVTSHIFTELFTTLNEAACDTSDFKDALTVFVSTYIEYLKKYGAYPLMMYKGMEYEELRDRHKDVIERFGRAPSHAFVEKIEQAIENDEIRPVDPTHTFMSIMGSCVYLFVSYPVLSLSNKKIEENIHEIIEERKTHIVDLVYNGLKKHKE